MAEAEMSGAYPWASGSLLTPTRMNLHNKVQLAQYELLGRVTAGTGDAERVASNAGVFALLAVTPAADKLPYFTGTGSAGVADFTSAARALLAQTTAPAQRNVIHGTDSLGALTGTVALDFGGAFTYGGLMTGNTTFTSTNEGSGRRIRIYAWGPTSYTWTFPAAWKWVGGKPTSKTANKYALIELQCFSNLVIARYTEET